MNCRNCHEKLKKLAKFCSKCGTKVILTCKECNNELDITDKFCSECGTRTQNINEKNDKVNYYIDNKQDINLKIGDYIKFGKFYGKDLSWVVINHDKNNNPMLFSEKVICNGIFDEHNNRWKTSKLRTWLNNEEIDGEYEEFENGFLCLDNFSNYEKSIIKNNTYEVIMSDWLLDLEDVDSNKYSLKNILKDFGFNYEQPLNKFINLGINLSNARTITLTDKVFLLSFDEILNLYNSELSGLVKAKYLNEEIYKICYWLNTPIPRHNDCIFCGGYGLKMLYQSCNNNSYGIRPALYLNKSKINNIVGNGTKKNPYRLID